MIQQINEYLKAGYPALWIQNTDEAHVISDLMKVAKVGKGDAKHQLNVCVWSTTKGLLKADGTALVTSTDIEKAFEYIGLKGTDFTLYIFKNPQKYIENPKAIQTIKDLIPIAKEKERHLVFISSTAEVPGDLEKDIAFIDYPLPSKNDLEKILYHLLTSNNLDQKEVITHKELVLNAAVGLTATEAENAFSLAYAKHRAFNLEAARTIQKLKASFIRSLGCVDYIEPTYSLSDIGGLEELKDWLILRKESFTEEAREFGLPMPKGVMVAGVPGGGKSLAGKAISAAWNLPLLRFDISQVFNSLLGDTEKLMREVLMKAEAISPCILWIDEIDKAFSGVNGSNDSGVASRIFGQFLTWMQEKQKPVFVFATANNVNALPPEFLRKGRFDEFFWVDLPNVEERKGIFQIHLVKRNFNPNDYEIERLAIESQGYTGAEIESAIISGLYQSYKENKRKLTTHDIQNALQDSIPLSLTMKEQIETMREWAKGRAKLASRSAGGDEKIIDLDEVQKKNSGRKLY